MGSSQQHEGAASPAQTGPGCTVRPRTPSVTPIIRGDAGIGHTRLDRCSAWTRNWSNRVWADGVRRAPRRRSITIRMTVSTSAIGRNASAPDSVPSIVKSGINVIPKPDETIWLHTSALSTVCHFSGGESPNTRCATRSIRYPERRPDEDLLAQVVDRHLGPGGEAVVGWHDRDGPSVEQLGRHEVGMDVITGKQGHQTDVERALPQSALHLLVAQLTQVDRRVRIGQGPTAQCRQHDRADAEVHTADPRLAVELRLAPRGRAQPVGGVQDLDDPGEQSRAGGVDAGPGPVPVQQRHAELALELGDRLAQRRLRDVQLLSGAPQRSVLADRPDVLQLLQPHGASSISSVRLRDRLHRSRDLPSAEMSLAERPSIHSVLVS